MVRSNQYDPAKVVIGGLISPEDDPFYTFTLASLAFSVMDNIDFGDGGPIAYTVDPADFCSGVAGIDFYLLMKCMTSLMPNSMLRMGVIT
ncbi:MAG: hypothetical protein ACJAUL_002878 [Paraglaciecola sp.]